MGIFVVLTHKFGLDNDKGNKIRTPFCLNLKHNHDLVLFLCGLIKISGFENIELCKQVGP